MKRIATHKQPDGDALAALWLAERFLFAEETVEIVFVSRGTATDADCVVDVGNEYDPARLRFDHKPPAFTDRNAHCATQLLWEYMATLPEKREVADPANLTAWVQIVHEGDANPPRSPSPALRESRGTGYHRAIRDARQSSTDDFSLFLAVRAWLDARFLHIDDLGFKQG